MKCYSGFKFILKFVPIFLRFMLNTRLIPLFFHNGRSDFEGAQALADEYILQTRGYQPDLSDEDVSPTAKGRDPEFSALQLEVSSMENSHSETLDLHLRPYRYSDCSDLNDQSENAEADQYQVEADQRDTSLTGQWPFYILGLFCVSYIMSNYSLLVHVYTYIRLPPY